MPAPSSLQSIINHVFLPPQLPDTQDTVFDHSNIAELVIASLYKFAAISQGSDREKVSTAITAITNFVRLRDAAGAINDEKLRDILPSAAKAGKLHHIRIFFV